MSPLQQRGRLDTSVPLLKNRPDVSLYLHQKALPSVWQELR